MKAREELATYFDAEFAEFERNRMCPPGYGKDTNMTKPNRKHLTAITHSVHLLEHGLADEVEKRFHCYMVRDISLLTEIKNMLFQMIANPTLPFVGPAVPILAEAESLGIRMTKPTHRHIEALTRNVHLLENGLADDIEKRFKHNMMRDIELLTEVKDMLFEKIENPTLPFMEPPAEKHEPFIDWTSVDQTEAKPDESPGVESYGHTDAD